MSTIDIKFEDKHYLTVDELIQRLNTFKEKYGGDRYISIPKIYLDKETVRFKYKDMGFAEHADVVRSPSADKRERVMFGIG